MNTQYFKRSISVALSFCLILQAPLAMGQTISPPTQTDGGGAKPPLPPEGNSGSLASEPDRNNKANEIVPGAKGKTGQAVRYVGRNDVLTHLPRVYTYERRWPTQGKKIFGTLTADGRVAWDIPSNYKTATEVKDVLPRNKSLVVVQNSPSEVRTDSHNVSRTKREAAETLKNILLEQEKVDARKQAEAKHQAEKIASEAKPATQVPYEPIPLNRSLVAQPQYGSGNAEVSSHYKEYLAKEKPSNLGNALGGWTSDKVDAMAKGIRKTKSRLRWMKRDYKNAPAQEVKTSEPSRLLGGETLQIGKSSAIFYIALGVAAGITLMARYPNDPLAWEHYLETLKDPVGYLVLGSFIATAGWVYKMLPSKTFRGQMGVFSLAMLAGSLVSDAVYDFANDPSVLKCLGFTVAGQIPLVGVTNYFLPRDLVACDKAHEKWSSPGRYADALYPTIAGFVAATGIFMAGTAAFHYGAVALAIKGIKIPKFPAGGLATAVLIGGQVLLYFGADWIANQFFGVEKYFRELKVTTFTFASDELGKNTINSSEDQLFYNWSVLRAKGWKDIASVDKITQLLERNGSLQKQWRQLQLMAAYDAYKHWLQKISDFKNMESYSYDIYRNVMGFNQSLKSQRKAFDFSNNMQDYLEYHRGAKSIEPPKVSYDLNSWSGVKTSDPFDYMLLSMACGPDAESDQSSGWKDVGLALFGMANSDLVISDPGGSEARFHPPRMIGKDSDNMCDQIQRSCSKGGCRMDTVSKIKISTPTGTVIGIEDYLEKNLRQDIGARNGITFDDWWESNVRFNLIPLELEFRAQYQHALDIHFTPPMLDKTYPRCEDNPYAAATGLDVYLQALAQEGEVCDSRKTHRLARGVINNLRDEMRLYMSMLAQLANENQKDLLRVGEELSEDQFNAQFMTPAREILTTMDLLTTLMNSKEVKKARVDEIEIAFNLQLAILAAGLKAPKGRHLSVGRPLLYQTLFGRLALTTTQALDYVGILAAFDRIERN